MGEDACLNPTGNYCAPNIDVRFDVEIDCYISTQCKCLHEQAHLETLYGFVPYLYPFTIEFNILVGKFGNKHPSFFFPNSWEKIPIFLCFLSGNLVYDVGQHWTSCGTQGYDGVYAIS